MITMMTEEKYIRKYNFIMNDYLKLAPKCTTTYAACLITGVLVHAHYQYYAAFSEGIGIFLSNKEGSIFLAPLPPFSLKHVLQNVLVPSIQEIIFEPAKYTVCVYGVVQLVNGADRWL